MLTRILGQAEAELEGGGLAIFLVIWLAVVVFLIASWWRVFTKAGQPGWAALIPIYNLIVLLRIAGRPWWWVFLILIPIVNIVVLIIMNIDVAKNFGKSAGFGVGLALLGVVFYPILAWGGATYAPTTTTTGMAPPAPGYGANQPPPPMPGDVPPAP